MPTPLLCPGLDALGIEFWINSGTLLGWLRECGFIPHSHDVDIGVYADDFDQDRLEELEREHQTLRKVWGHYQYATPICKVCIGSNMIFRQACLVGSLV